MAIFFTCRKVRLQGCRRGGCRGLAPRRGPPPRHLLAGTAQWAGPLLHEIRRRARAHPRARAVEPAADNVGEGEQHVAVFWDSLERRPW
jgi:hypothetical protein